MTTYIRRPLDDGAQFIIQTEADRWEPPPSRIPFWTAALVFIGMMVASIPGGIVLAFIVAFIVHRVLRRIDAVMFTHASAGDRDTWIEKLVDAGQPTRLPRLSQPGEPA
jgi:hypothetical protein